MPRELDVPDLPVELKYLWNHFQALSRKRTVGLNAENPLSDLEIMAWQQRNKITFTPFENDCIDALDQAYMDRGRTQETDADQSA